MYYSNGGMLILLAGKESTVHTYHRTEVSLNTTDYLSTVPLVFSTKPPCLAGRIFFLEPLSTLTFRRLQSQRSNRVCLTLCWRLSTKPKGACMNFDLDYAEDTEWIHTAFPRYTGRS